MWLWVWRRGILVAVSSWAGDDDVDDDGDELVLVFVHWNM